MNDTPFRFPFRYPSILGKLARKVILYLAVAASCALNSAAYAEMNIENLVQAMKSGDVEIMSITGNGGSSGPVLKGYLLNRSSVSKYLDVRLDRALFFKNKGSGQNIIATQIYQRDLSYMSDGERSFISLEPDELLEIMFIAYCVEFEKDNPSSGESFAIREIPQNLSEIAKKISAFEKANPSKDATISAQLALWREQGVSLKKISEKFEFDRDDETEMRAILRTSE